MEFGGSPTDSPPIIPYIPYNEKNIILFVRIPRVPKTPLSGWIQDYGKGGGGERVAHLHAQARQRIPHFYEVCGGPKGVGGTSLNPVCGIPKGDGGTSLNPVYGTPKGMEGHP